MAVSEEQILKILEQARYAPSVHNTQPWLISLKEAGVYVQINKQRVLEFGDPVKRQAWISLGCYIEAMAVAGRKFGLDSGFKLISGNRIEAKLKQGQLPSRQDDSLYDAITVRFTDRSEYSSSPLPRSVISRLKALKAEKGTSLIMVEDRETIRKVAKLISQGILLAFSNPSFRNELAKHISTPLKRQADGIPTKSLRINPLMGLFEPGLVRSGLNSKLNTRKDLHNWSASPAIVLILSEGDNKEYWLKAGRTYMRVALMATSLGLRSSTSAATVEAADFHEDIENMVGSNQRLQAVMRVGYSQSPSVQSPRVPLEQLLLHRAD